MGFAAALSRASKRILDRAGEDALLRGAATINKVHIAQDVDLVDAQGNMVVESYVGTISNEDAPVRGDTLVHPLGTFVLESAVDNNGFSSRFVLRKTA